MANNYYGSIVNYFANYFVKFLSMQNKVFNI